MVLTVLHPPAGREEELKVDVVAVHGLNGDPAKTWTHPKTGAFWLKDFLPFDITGVRVLTFGYNANVVFGNSTAHIIDHAKDLLSSLIDEREDSNESQRPIIFIAHSLGGIVVKQALLQAFIEPQYKDIHVNTIGLIFLGTPHRGSDKANYGKILANIATAAMHKPSSHLTNALQTNSNSLMRLNSDFRFRLPNYQVVSFYELKPSKPFSTLIVEKYSALIEFDREDQIPVDANHSDICKFGTRDDGNYRKLSKRITRMLKSKDTVVNSIPLAANQYYEVPHNLSSVFTGRQDICEQLRATCLPSQISDTLPLQKRFILYGLGGSGKTQVCLKFTQDYRERFWAIFWIDASSKSTVEQRLQDLCKVCELKEDVELIKRWLSNLEKPWLLIFDNADDPSLDVSQYFPTGGRGSILVTTRNPECKIHATVGSSEFHQMELEDAVTLLLRSAIVKDVLDENLRTAAKPIVELLGCLALAIVQAGAVIRQKLCRMDEYCTIYSSQRSQLLSHQPVQASYDYKYTVYTTWQISIDMIAKMSTETAENALEILQLFSFMHFENLSEEVLKEVWQNIHDQKCPDGLQSFQLRMLRSDHSSKWDPSLARNAIVLLSSFSLVNLDEMNRISMHPLVHSWARDRLNKQEQIQCWKIAASTMAASVSWSFRSLDYKFRRLLLTHIDSCLEVGDLKVSLTDSTQVELTDIAEKFALVYKESGQWKKAAELQKKVLERRGSILGKEHRDTLVSMNNLAHSYSQLGQWNEAVVLQEKVLERQGSILGKEHPHTLVSMGNLARSYSQLGQGSEAVVLQEKVLDEHRRILGEEHPHTLVSMSNLARSYRQLGQGSEAVVLEEKVLDEHRRILGEEHPDTLVSMSNLAYSYRQLGRGNEAVVLEEKVLERHRRILGEEHPDTLVSMNNLACSYGDLGQWSEAVVLQEKVLERRRKILGEEHPDTLVSMGNLACSYGDLGRWNEAVVLQEKVLEGHRRILGKEHPDTLSSMGNLAVSYSQLGRGNEAVVLQEKVLERRRRILGEEHPNTLMSMSNLAVSYSDLDRGNEAVVLYEKALEISKRTQGEDHPKTLLYQKNLRVILAGQNESDKAQQLKEPKSKWNPKRWIRKHYPLR